jgi:hypothetical protein
LSDGDSQARFFIEVSANNAWSTDVNRRSRWAHKESIQSSHGQLHDLGFGLPDFQGRISFVAKDDKETSAAAIVGSGEFGVETTVGFPFYRSIVLKDSETYKKCDSATELYDKTEHTHWLGLVGSWSGVTDGSAFDIHSRYFFGLGYRAAFKAPWTAEDGDVGREAALNFQIGYAMVDAVKFANRDVDRTIRLRNGDVPDYSEEGAMGVEAEFFIPVTKSLDVVVGTRLYTGIDPNPWNAYIAATFPLDKLAKILE